MGERSPQNAVFFARQTRVLLLSDWVELKMSLLRFDRDTRLVLFYHLVCGFEN